MANGWPSRTALSHYVVPPLVAAILTIAYFAIFNRWTSFDNPISSIVVPILGAIGFAAGAALDQWRINRAKRPATQPDAAS